MPITVAKNEATNEAGIFPRFARHMNIPALNSKVGATAGWVITGGTNISHATLPASQTSSTLVIPITGLHIGDKLNTVTVCGQIESAGGAVTLTMDVRKLTNAAADNVDASLGTDNVGSVTADAVIQTTVLTVSGLSEIVDEGESFYVLLTGTTAASTDIDLSHIVVSVNLT